MHSRYWPGDAVLQLAVVHFQSQVPWIPIQLPDELRLMKILQFQSKCKLKERKFLSAINRVLSTAAMQNFFPNYNLMFIMLNSKLDTVCLYKISASNKFAKNRAFITTVHSKLSSAKRCLLILELLKILMPRIYCFCFVLVYA